MNTPNSIRSVSFDLSVTAALINSAGKIQLRGSCGPQNGCCFSRHDNQSQHHAAVADMPPDSQLMDGFGFKVAINQPVHACDAWVVYQGLFRPRKPSFRPNGFIFSVYEPRACIITT